MENTKRAFKYQYNESKISILKFWVVLLILNAVLYFVNIRYGNQMNIGMSFEIGTSEHLSLGGSSNFEEVKTFISVAGANLAIILIYVIASSYENYYKSFPIAIGFSVTRRDFFKSFIARNTWITLVFSIIQGVLQKIDPVLINLAEKKPIYEFLIFNAEADSIFFIIFSIFMWLTFLLAFFSLVASLNYKFGYMFWVVLGSAYIIVSFSNVFSVFEYITRFLGIFLNLKLYWSSLLNMGLFILVSYGLLYLVTIQINVKDKT